MVVVRLLSPMEGNGATIFRSLQNSRSPSGGGVVVFLKIYHSGILNMTVSFMDFKDAILFLQGLFFVCTFSLYLQVHFCHVRFVSPSLTDYFDDRTFSIRF